MRKDFGQMIQQYIQKNKNRSIWRKLVRVLACIVVFCTTYALILPVITLEQDYVCGLEEHIHVDQCYQKYTDLLIPCTQELLGVHAHSGECYDRDGNIRCGYSDKLIHIHEDVCFNPEGALICQLAEIPAHSHTDACYAEDALICGYSALVAHTHTGECTDGSAVCESLETLSHQHTQDCIPAEAPPELICGMTEHFHSADCYPEQEPVNLFSLLTRKAGDAATLTLKFTSWGPWNAIEFPEGNTYACQVGSLITITLDDYSNRGVTYVTPSISVSGCEVVSVQCTCDQGHNAHSNAWYNCGLRHEIVLRVTDTNANIECNISGYDWPREGNSVVVTNPSVTDPTQPPTEPPTDPPTDPPTEPPTEPPTDPPTQPPEGPTDPTEPPTDPPTDPPTEPPTEPTEPPPTEIPTDPPTEPPTDSETPRPGYPVAVKTGQSAVDTLYFYNFAATDTGIHPLAGCKFLITGTTDDGQPYSGILYSGDTLETRIPHSIPTGKYTITEVSAPDGYLRDSNHTREFEVVYNETLGQKTFGGSTIGSFLNHSTAALDAGKYAEVEDYNNRTYEVVLQAESSIRLFEMEPIDVLFVVDQSNSMLFPSGLQETGQTITLYQNPSESWYAGNQNLRQMSKLDQNQLYYIIADPTGTSTVFAVWHNGERWMYQDASYYAKAWYDNADGYRQDGEIAIFPRSNVAFSDQPTTNDQGQKVRANGGDLGMTISGTLGNYIGSGSNKTFQVYTAVNQYNRLHYLEESISRAIYQLSDANVKNTATLIRFTKDVDEAHCMGPMELPPENADILVDAVNKINTSGGTRQDLALEHAYNHLTGNITYKDGSRGDKYTKDIDHTFTILITDGAPVRSNDSAPDINTIYSQIRSYGAQVRRESTLVTIGLGMGNVEGGKKVLQEIATLPQYANMLEDASDLTETLHDLLFSSLEPKETSEVSGDVVDVISDSFYPIAWTAKGTQTGRSVLYSDGARDWIVLEPGDWITLDGEFVGTRQGSRGHGRLTRNADGDLQISWNDRTLADNTVWTGRFYVKAKEDFIGGNAIDTNKRASVDVGGTALELPVPTVNVRLLDLNQGNSEVTVYLGDLINGPGDSPLDSLKYFYNNTKFTKIHADLNNRNGLDFGPIQNAVDPGASQTDGLEADTFLLKYAIGRDLTASQWAHLMASESHTVKIDYTYDDASSHGPVGYFTFRLTKNGESAAYESHEATVAGQRVEDYTLHVTYTAYELSEVTRPDVNVHNGTAGPGTEVSDRVSSGRLEDGYGIVDKDNIHIVNVISGSIRVTKEITPELISDADQIFRFTLHREEDGDDFSADLTLEVTVQAGQTTGFAQVDGLKRGTYALTEQHSDVYSLRDITVEPETNCYAIAQIPAAIFHMGNDPNDHNVIGKHANDRYTSYIAPPNGVFGAAKVVNEKTVHYGQLPVQKIWGGVDTEGREKTVFVVLCQHTDTGDQLVLDTAGNARLLRLDAENGWQGSFRVALPEKGTEVSSLGYFIREVSGIGSTDENRQQAILENDGTTILYYQSVIGPEELLDLGGDRYVVTYDIDQATGTYTVTNHLALSLPATGGMGTNLYTFSGLTIIIVALLMYGYSCVRRRERGTGQ
ncbi:MAG: hypothetical protein IJO28_08775 [Oscillospiraceae bacterium]|nr:hypothetical protein [Oscillospiraceae bacterium]